MKVIMLEKVEKLKLGQVVDVKPGYARNYLIPRGKAVSATPANLADFERRRQEFEGAQKRHFAEDQQRAQMVEGMKVTIAMRMSEEGKLFGSVTAVDIIKAVEALNPELKLQRTEVLLPDGPIRSAGEHKVALAFHHGELRAELVVDVVAAAAASSF